MDVIIEKWGVVPLKEPLFGPIGVFWAKPPFAKPPFRLGAEKNQDDGKGGLA